MRLIEKNNNEFVIRERTSLKGNSGDITNLNISSELYHEIKDLDSSKILIEKIIYDKETKCYITVLLDYNQENFLNLEISAGKNKGKSYRLRLESSNLLEIKRSKSIILNKKTKSYLFIDIKEIKNTVQKRAITGFIFEREICEIKGWLPDSKSPKLFWKGQGKSWVEKLKSVNFNVEEFKIDLKKSKFEKWDATDGENNYEIKKYDTTKLKGYTLYSEPIIKIAPSRSKWKEGNSQYDVFPTPKKYNQFINNLMNSYWWKKDSEKILNKIINSSKGIQFKDRFIEKNDIEFSWKLNTGKEGIAPIFEGYHRLSIVFKLKIN